MARTNEKILIFGAGLSGLSCHKTLQDLNKTPVGLEKNDYIFGHARSYKFSDLNFDEGPHISFTKRTDIQKMIWNDSDNVITSPKIINYWRGFWIPHPVITNVFELPIVTRMRLVASFFHRSRSSHPSNYLEWSRSNFGAFYTSNFVDLYTRKYWQTDLSDLSVEWAGARVYTPSFLEVLTGSFRWTKKLSKMRKQHYFSQFHYSREGGFENLFKIFEPKSNFILNSEVVNLNLREKYTVTDSGEKFSFTQIFNSIPLPELFKVISDDIPNFVSQAVSELRCTSLLLVDLVFDTPPLMDCHWAYVYDLKYHSTRFHFPQLFSGGFDSPHKYAIQVEVYDSKLKELQDDEIIKQISREIVDMKVFSGSVIAGQVKRIKYANVVFDHNRERAVGVIRKFLNEHDVALIGRYGNWDYSWSDDAIQSGIQSALDYVESEKK